jgi:dihydroflavonol-4-reductase
MQEDCCIKWLETNKNVEGLTEIVTLHPSFIVGPVLNSLASSSVEGIKKLVNGSIPVVPSLHLPTIDVRDCA